MARNLRTSKIVDLHTMQNNMARIHFLLNQVDKYAKELDTLGVSVKVECKETYKLFKKELVSQKDIDLG